MWFVCFFRSPAGVLPGLPHQEGLRGDRAEHLPPQPRVRSHVLTWTPRGLRAGGRGSQWCFFMTCPAMDGVGREGDPEYKRKKKKRGQTERSRLDIYCERSFFQIMLLIIFFFSKWGEMVCKPKRFWEHIWVCWASCSERPWWFNSIQFSLFV